MTLELAAVIVSGLALAVSVVFSVRHLSLQRRITLIEQDRRREETSALRADVAATFEDFYTEKGFRALHLMLLNRGPARAEGVEFELHQRSEGDLPDVPIKGEQVVPIALDPWQPYRFLALHAMDVAPSVDVTLRWTDGTGPQEKRLTLSTL